MVCMHTAASPLQLRVLRIVFSHPLNDYLIASIVIQLTATYVYNMQVRAYRRPIEVHNKYWLRMLSH
jgi:hypothetical protein